MFRCAGEGMFGEKQNYFKNGRIDQAALVAFIKDIKKNTSLSDEDAATLAASKVKIFIFSHYANIFLSKLIFLERSFSLQ